MRNRLSLKIIFFPVLTVEKQEASYFRESQCVLEMLSEKRSLTDIGVIGRSIGGTRKVLFRSIVVRKGICFYIHNFYFLLCIDCLHRFVFIETLLCVPIEL